MSDYVPAVDAMMDTLTGFAETAFNTAESAISALGGGVDDSALTTPTAPSPSLISPETAPSFSATVPVYGSAPVVPTVKSFSMPTKPSYTMPTAPVLSTINIPVFVPAAMPGLTATLPSSASLAVPSISEISVDDVTRDTLFETVTAKLNSKILDGGTLLNPTVEADIWNRDLERSEQALRDASDKLTGQWAKMGFSMPDGLLAGSLLALQTEYMNRSLDRSREIAVKQADLEQSGMLKCLELGMGFEQIIMTSANEFARRRLEAAKANGDILVAVFRERVNLFNAELAAFTADVTAWKTEIEAEMTRVEAFKAQMTGVQIQAGVDETRVKVYQAQVAGVEALVNFYNSDVKVVAMQYEAEAQKINMFKSQVDAYSANVDALIKQYVAAVEVFKNQVSAYATKNGVLTTNVESATRMAIAQYDSAIKLLDTQARRSEADATIRMEGLRAAAQAASNLAAGALSGIHTQATQNYSYQTAYQYSKSLDS